MLKVGGAFATVGGVLALSEEAEEELELELLEEDDPVDLNRILRKLIIMVLVRCSTSLPSIMFKLAQAPMTFSR